MPRTRNEARVELARVLASQGKTQREAAAELGVGVRTLRTWGIDWAAGRPRLPDGEGSRWTRRRRLESMMQVLEFSYAGGTIGGAIDVVRQATPSGEALPSVSQAGRLGFEVTAGVEVVARLRAALEERGEACYVTER